MAAAAPRLVEIIAPDGARSTVTRKVARLMTRRGWRLAPPGSEDPAAFVHKTSVARVLQWVDGIPARAELALERERESEKPRTTLVSALERILQT